MENAGGLNNPSKSNLTLVGRNSLSITGIKKVKTTEPNKVTAMLDNCQIVVCGHNLSVQNVSISSGTLDITGLVTSISYTNSQGRRFSIRNLFK